MTSSLAVFAKEDLFSRVRRASYLPTISFSYRYRPIQSMANQLGLWTSDAWPVDSFLENDGSNPDSFTWIKGERHFFWINLRWNFEEAFFGDWQKKAIQIRRLKSRARVHFLEIMASIHREIENVQAPCESDFLPERIAYVSKRMELIAKADYFSSLAPTDDG